MTTKLRIAPDLALPTDAVTETFAFLGRRGSGKTYSAGVLAEELLETNHQVVIVDPLDVWWGLRASSDGKGDGYPVTIFGGQKADVPLQDTAGALLADVVVDHGISAIFSLRHLSRAGARRFVGAFGDRLYERKGDTKHRSPLHLIVDEADAFVPQHLSAGDERCYHAIDTIVRRGRSSGFGTTLISQRSAVIAKDVLTQTEILVSHQTTSPQDRKALLAWIEAHDSGDRAKEFMGSLASLPRGTAWFWSPGWLDVFQKIKVRDKRTFDSSKTPQGGVRPAEPKRMTPVDLAQLSERIAATVEEQKAKDPALLTKRIRELEAQIRKAPAAAPAKPPKVQRVEVSVLPPAAAKALAGLVMESRRLAEKASWLEEKAGKHFAEATRLEMEIRAALKAVAPRTACNSAPKPARLQATTTDYKQQPAPSGDLDRPQQRILDTIATLLARGLAPNRECVARWQDLHPNGGSYGANLGRLRAEGYLDGFRLTEKGEAAAHAQETGFDALLAALPDEPKRSILRTLDQHGAPMSREEVAAALNLHPNGGSYGANLGWLRTMQVITERGPIALTSGATR